MDSRRYTWVGSEGAARARWRALRDEMPKLLAVWNEYQRLYNLHIKPLEVDARKYFANMGELRKIEHYLQGLDAERQKYPPPPSGKRSWTLPPQIEKLPYADKDEVGKKHRAPADPETAKAKEAMKKLKALPPEQFAALLKQIGGK